MTPELARAVAAHRVFFERVETSAADEFFQASAIATARAQARGVTCPTLAQHFKRVAAERKAARNLPAYTSPTSVGYHGRTGRLLLKALPKADLSARDVQTLVKTVGDECGVREVDRCLRVTQSQAEAVGELRKALRDHRCQVDEEEREMRQFMADPSSQLPTMVWQLNWMMDEVEVDAELLEQLVEMGRRADNLINVRLEE